MMKGMEDLNSTTNKLDLMEISKIALHLPLRKEAFFLQIKSNIIFEV